MGGASGERGEPAGQAEVKLEPSVGLFVSCGRKLCMGRMEREIKRKFKSWSVYKSYHAAWRCTSLLA